MPRLSANCYVAASVNTKAGNVFFWTWFALPHTEQDGEVPHAVVEAGGCVSPQRDKATCLEQGLQNALERTSATNDRVVEQMLAAGKTREGTLVALFAPTVAASRQGICKTQYLHSFTKHGRDFVMDMPIRARRLTQL
jgi:hypothetical protein